MRWQCRDAPKFLLPVEPSNRDRFTQSASNELPIGAVDAAVVIRRRCIHRWLLARFAANHAPGRAAVVSCERFCLPPGVVYSRRSAVIRKLDLTVPRALEGHAHWIAVSHGVAWRPLNVSEL